MDYLIDLFSDFMVWLKDLLLWLPLKLTELLLDGLALLVESIPVPTWLQGAGGFLSAIDPTVAFFLEAFQFGQGLTIVIAAYIIRFLIRRIPVIG